MGIKGLVVGVILGAAAGASAAEYATTTPAPIRGCYAKSSGALQILASSKATCRSKERAISWNAQGPPGSAGQGLSFARDNAPTVSTGTALLYGVRSSRVAVGGTYTISGSVSIPCLQAPPEGAPIDHYNVEIAVLKADDPVNASLVTATPWSSYPATICGSTIRVPPSAVAVPTGDTLMVVVTGTVFGSPIWPTSLSFALRGATDQEL